MKNSSNPVVKRVPQRTCVSCRKVSGKRELVRLVYLSGGEVLIDASGRAPGRGAYLCRNANCWEAGVKRGRLGHALRTKLSAEDAGKLLEYARSLSQGESVES